MNLDKSIAAIWTQTGVSIGVISLTEIRELSAITLAVVSTICTVLITLHKIRKKKP